MTRIQDIFVVLQVFGSLPLANVQVIFLKLRFQIERDGNNVAKFDGYLRDYPERVQTTITEREYLNTTLKSDRTGPLAHVSL